MKGIKEVSIETGLPASTLRYYESEGLIPPVQRTESGLRSYNEEDIEWVYFVTAMRQTGMSISLIQKYLELYYEGDVTISERRLMMLNHKIHVEHQLADIYRHLEKINYKLALYDVLEAEMNNKKLRI
ncbi:MerR family transcriptional regulator [Bacillus thuringiensis]|uniref:MerR family transcriptional regulator n=1 Tax=Bacillus thuringiensis TaxID=1428 RepID=UPI000BECBE71|nr:MerR family transcriptional regulator [Bacillus thuringiensis]PDY55691.1 MerR family transcriptional regulator [Bacillus thuringiensis]PEV21375.1 MerR family transcriptional regulator [Bacillus thuringiensis]PEW70424.1 MerR family transcriptional regulator [Bacillus thuringiensis]PFA31023.1 MerR family transcriptional regulator [Bacillus thuringiensis]PFD29023.1 MerR family transcriptional regulator [Bacillus thuringiensis]